MVDVGWGVGCFVGSGVGCFVGWGVGKDVVGKLVGGVVEQSPSS